MPYVSFAAAGGIASVVTAETSHAEWIAADDERLLDFLKRQNDPDQVAQALKDTDAEFARVTEDLIQILIQKSVLLFTDLPEPVRKKILAREHLRQVLHKKDVGLLSDDGAI